jgi:hypothetical protein
MSGWGERGLSGARVPGEKGGKGVLGALLTMKGVATAEAAEAPVMGQLLAASSCIDGERVARGGSRLWSKTWWCDNARKAAA